MTDSRPLAAAIADLEVRRAALGDAVVDAAIAALRAQLARVASTGSFPAPAPAPSAAPAASARLRQVSILFADIADSTALLQRVAADEALELVSAALECFTAVVRAAGSEVLRFTGDGPKAAFGVEGPREDDAERAVRAGLGILDAARAPATQVQGTHGLEQFGVRVGVHTGPVVLGTGVEADRSAMGHAVHLAARMEQSAAFPSRRRRSGRSSPPPACCSRPPGAQGTWTIQPPGLPRMQSPPRDACHFGTNSLPGLNSPCGSSAAFSRRISSTSTADL